MGTQGDIFRDGVMDQNAAIGIKDLRPQETEADWTLSNRTHPPLCLRVCLPPISLYNHYPPSLY